MKYTNTNLNLYKTFIAVYETGSTMASADVLHVGQTAASRNMKELERQLGVKLFHANPRGLKPTKVADELYKYIQSAFTEINNGENYIKSVIDANAGHIRIGCYSYIANFIILDFLHEFYKQNPNIKIEITSVSALRFDSLLERHDIDMIIDIVPNKSENFATLELANLTNTFYVSKKFAEDNKIHSKLSLKDLTELPILLYTKSHYTMKKLEKALGAKLAPTFEMSTSELMYGMVARGMGVGYALNAFLDNCHSDNEIARLAVNAELPTSTLAVTINKKDKNPLVEQFVKGLQKHFSSAPQN